MDAPHSLHQSPLALREPKFTFNDSTYSLALSSLADTLSTNCSVTTFSTSETILGPGALSGKAILALGKATLRGAERLVIRRRVQAISGRFPHNNDDEFPGVKRMYEDVLELSRRDLYPDVLRSAALRIILAQIGSRQTDLLIKTRTTWAPIEVEFLISDLTEILDPLRRVSYLNPLTSLVWLNTVQIIHYQQDPRNTSVPSLSHQLGIPLFRIVSPFFRQLTRHSLVHSGTQISHIIMEGSAMDFLLRLYHSNFVDPLYNPNKEVYDGRWSFHKLCERPINCLLKGGPQAMRYPPE